MPHLEAVTEMSVLSSPFLGKGLGDEGRLAKLECTLSD